MRAESIEFLSAISVAIFSKPKKWAQIFFQLPEKEILVISVENSFDVFFFAIKIVSLLWCPKYHCMRYV